MLIIKNIQDLIGTKFKIGENETSCVAVDEYFWKESLYDKDSYVIDFKLSVESDVPLVLWLNRDQNNEMGGWKLTNNLVNVEVLLSNKDVESLESFTKSIQVYLDSCDDIIRSEFDWYD
jgi:hypothetical protein